MSFLFVVFRFTLTEKIQQMKKNEKYPAWIGSRITEEQKEKVERLANQMNLSQSEFLRDFITNILMKLP